MPSTDWDRFAADLSRLLANKRYSLDRSHSECMADLASTRIQPPAPVPSDHGSDEYKRYQMRLYEHIAGKRYEPEKTELATGLSLEEAVADPWPFQTRDPGTIGHYLMGVAQILRVLGRCPTRSVLEYGPGWGHTSIAMARSGLEVTAVDVEPMFLRFIERSAALHNCTIRTHHGTFGEMPDLDAKFDAVVFFESFHHCFDHRQMIQDLRSHLSPGGRFVLCNENIGPTSPYPWGIRMDAHSLWAVSQLGWMELGFTEQYILELFRSEGFSVIKHHIAEAGDAALCYEAHL